MKTLKPLTIEDLNPHFLKTKSQRAYAQGLLHACNMVNEMYGRTSSHSHAIGDCVLGKLNFLKRGKRIRRTPK